MFPLAVMFPVVFNVVKVPSEVTFGWAAVPIVPTKELPVIVPLELIEPDTVMFPLAVMGPVNVCSS